ncbi:hypothetical protein [Pyxidicoccus sp. MSG2]|uniref:hypothetical protein n=1 Tax=Pyxidicoccus sp. MSG2 TaxID=2996790 RepID=UPI00226D63AF|nr:hypothetical protein [Pyxidicoccus sp. MSG2]MCY1021351.1 hypothetical protein [Pyxidicoccus sp. MSG2]
MRTDHRSVRIGVMTMLATCTALWASAALGQAPAAPTPIQVVTALPVVLGVRDPRQPSELRTLELRVNDGAVPTAFQVIEARLPERPDDFSAAFTPGPVDVKAPLPKLPITVHPPAMPFTGTYTVRLRPVRDGKPEPARDIQLTFQRPAARLRVQGPWQLEHTLGSDSLAPTTLLIEEASALAHVNLPLPVAGRLRGPGGETLSAEIRFTASLAPDAGSGELGAGQKLELVPRLEGSVPLGVSTGTVRLESPQLAAPVDVDLRLVSRAPLCWLPITIIGGILLGLIYRQCLEEWQKSDEALLEASKVHARLEQLAASEADEGVRNKVRAALQPLTSAIQSKAGADGLTAAATKAGEAVDAVLAEAEERRKAVRTSLATLASDLSHPAGHSPAIAKLLGEARREREALLEQLDRGHVEGPEKRAGDLRPELREKLGRALGDLITSLSRDVDSLGPWPDTAIPDGIPTLKGVLAEANTTRDSADLAALMQSALKVARSAHSLFVQTARPEVVRVTERAVDALGLKPDDASLAPVQEALQAVLAPAAAEEGPPYPALTSALATLSARLVELIGAKTAAATKATVEAALKTHDYVKAAKSARPVLESYGPTAKPPTGQLARLAVANLIAGGTQPLGAVHIFQLIGPLEAAVGQTIELRPLVEPAPPEGVQVAWRILEGHVREIEHDGSRLVVMAQAPGPLRVMAELRDPRTQAPISAVGVVRILPSASELAAMDIRKRLLRRELLMTGLVGLFIAAGGTLLFSETFHGSWKDILIAALWGFSVDIGTTQLRQLAQPLTSQQIPVSRK